MHAWLGAHALGQLSEKKEKTAYLDVQPTPSVPRVHGDLLGPQPPVLPDTPSPLRPRQRLVRPSRRQPHGDAEDLVAAALLGHVEERIAHSPAAADAERDAVAG